MRSVVQFTGLSGAGKTTLSVIASERLAAQGYSVALLDGDALRKTLSADLGFSKDDRLAHLRRLAHLANETDVDIVLIAVINPYEAGRSYFGKTCDARLVWLKFTLNLPITHKRIKIEGRYSPQVSPTDYLYVEKKVI